jgi:hypothetical protein
MASPSFIIVWRGTRLLEELPPVLVTLFRLLLRFDCEADFSPLVRAFYTVHKPTHNFQPSYSIRRIV